MRHELADMTDFDEGSDPTEIDMTRELATSSRAQTELDIVPEPLWFEAVDLAQPPEYFDANPTSPIGVAKRAMSSNLGPTGSHPIVLESSTKPHLAAVDASVGIDEVPVARGRSQGRSKATPLVSKTVVPSALLWEYLGLAIAAVSTILLYQFIQRTGTPVAGAMLFPLFLLSGTMTWFALGVLGRYTWFCPLLSALGLWVLLNSDWQLLGAMYGGYMVIVTVRVMVPSGGGRVAVSG